MDASKQPARPDDLLAMLRMEYTQLGKTPLPDSITSVDQYYRHLADAPPLTALCLSGGGIRSASYGLGVLQALAQNGLLDKFDYLSSVSGGGYIAAWLQRLRRQRSMSGDRGSDDLQHVAETLDPDITPQPRIEALRAMSSYLAPRLGATSPDLWAGIVLWMRNMALNWLVLMPLLLACLQLPWILADFIQALETVTHPGTWARRVEQAVLALPALAALGYGLTNAAWYRRHAPPRLTRTVDTRTIMLHVLLPILIGVVFLSCKGAVYGGIAHPRVGAIGGLLLYLSAEFGAVVRRATHTPTPLWRIWKRTRSRQLPCMKNPVPVWLEIVIWTGSGAVAGWIYGLLPGWIGSGAPAWTGLGFCASLQVLLFPNFLFAGLGSYSNNGDVDREWLARVATLFLSAAVIWGLLCIATLFLGPMTFKRADHFYTALTAGASTGLAAALAGASRYTAATFAKRVSTRIPTAWILQAACLAFLVTLLIGFSRLEPALLGPPGIRPASPAAAAIVATPACKPAASPVSAPPTPCTGNARWPAKSRLAWIWLGKDFAVLAALVAFAALVSVAVNINRFSLHGVYRNRLVRTFLGAARDTRHPNRFTGFDQSDNLPMSHLWPIGRCGLFPVINTTLNLVSAGNPALQERKAESFSITPLHCGAPKVGYRRTGCYGGMRDGISLGTAITISGAAVSPNMGYHSSPLVGIIMTLFNVRLGAWLGNPSGDAGVARGDGPRYAAFALLRELFGITNDKSGYVYLSDGGHFENLGVYEMLRRRCRFILAVDAGADPKAQFDDLGGLVRKARLDFDIEIDFTRMSIAARADPARRGVDAAIASVKYPEGGPDRATLIYLKPGFTARSRSTSPPLPRPIRTSRTKPPPTSSSSNPAWNPIARWARRRSGV